jgi:hypothetical protein
MRELELRGGSWPIRYDVCFGIRLIIAWHMGDVDECTRKPAY